MSNFKYTKSIVLSCLFFQVFCSTAIATFTLAMLTSMYEGSPLSFADSGAVKFGNLVDLDENTILDLPAGIILGVVSGLLGALFIYVNVNVNIKRKKYINTNIKKIIECCIFAFVTASCFYMVVALRSSSCKPLDVDKVDNEELFEFTCPEGSYNPLATLIFNTEGGTIR